MSSIDQVAAFIEQRFEKEIRAHRVMPPVAGDYDAFPEPLDMRLREVLVRQHITRLYNHQVESDAAVQCTRSLLRALIEACIVMPEIHRIRSGQSRAVVPPPPDEEAIKLERRLNKAAEILRKKREREH